MTCNDVLGADLLSEVAGSLVSYEARLVGFKILKDFRTWRASQCFRTDQTRTFTSPVPSLLGSRDLAFFSSVLASLLYTGFCQCSSLYFQVIDKSVNTLFSLVAEHSIALLTGANLLAQNAFLLFSSLFLGGTLLLALHLFHVPNK